MSETSVTIGSTEVKTLIAKELESYMKEHNLGRSAVAQKLETRPETVDMILHPKILKIHFSTLVRVAEMIGYRLQLTLDKI
jgi:hypothetical protein